MTYQGQAMRVWRPFKMALIGLLFCLTTQGADAPRSEKSEKKASPRLRLSECELAQRIDAALTKSLDKNTPLPSPADDATFLRRVSLDLTGKLPTPKEVEAFVADPNPHKRSRKISQLLNSESYAVNW